MAKSHIFNISGKIRVLQQEFNLLFSLSKVNTLAPVPGKPISAQGAQAWYAI